MHSIINILCNLFRFWPHIIVYKRSKAKSVIDYEISRWFITHHIMERRGVRGLVFLLAALPEFRSLFYFRTGKWWLSNLAKGQTNLEFYTESENIGKGLIIWHGFSTVINCDKMGEDCQVWQNVVIGKSSSDNVPDRPTIGNNVKIAANAVVVGPIHVGDNSVIGAGAVAVKDVPDDTVVVSQPSRYIKHSEK